MRHDGVRGACELGASAVEYALMVGLIAVVIMGAVASLGSALFGDEVEVLGHVLEQGEPEQGDLGQGNCKVAEEANETAIDNVCG